MTNSHPIHSTPIDIAYSDTEFRSGNPFFRASYAEIISPLGKVLTIPGFYSGQDTWMARFTPNEPGQWLYRFYLDDKLVDNGMVITEISSESSPRHITTDNRHPTRFVYSSSGQPFFMCGYECNWLWALEMAHPGENRVYHFLEKIGSYGFNTVLMNFFAYDCDWRAGKTSEEDYGPPPAIPWEGSINNPDYDNLNLDYFTMMDSVFRQALKAGIQIHLYFRVYNKFVPWPENNSPGDNLYFSYITARYLGFENLQWDFSKESYYELDKEYIANRLLMIQCSDPYHHLITLHDDENFVEGWSQHIDFITAQQHYDFHTHGKLMQSKYLLPYLNAEFGYEWGAKGKGDVTYGVGQSPVEMIRRAWEIVMAGGYPAYYYSYTAWDVIKENDTPEGYTYFKNLVDIVNRIEWHSFIPDNSYCLWRGARSMHKNHQQVIFFMENNIISNLQFHEVEGTWINIFSGEELALTKKHVTEQFMSTGLTLYELPFKKDQGKEETIQTDGVLEDNNLPNIGLLILERK